jgi:hypothetical protein
MDTKTCTSCGEAKPLDDDHWYWRVVPSSGSRVVNGARCKKCVRDAQLAAPHAERTDAQRERENAARRDARAAKGAKPRLSSGTLPDILRKYAPSPPVSDAERKRVSRAAQADRVGTDAYRAKRAADMAEYRAKKRAPLLMVLVALVADELDKGTSHEDIALELARAGVYITAGQSKK